MGADRSYEPYYCVQTFRHDSPRFAEHVSIADDVYGRKGFLPPAGTVVDPFDGPSALYYRFVRLTAPERAAGIMRMIEGGGLELPTRHASPAHAFRGIPDDVCESTRVIAARQRDFFGTEITLSQYILFNAVVESLAYVRRRNLSGVVSLGAPIIFEWINHTFGRGVQWDLCERFEYQGGTVIPSFILRSEFERIVRAHDSAIYAYYERACRRRP